MPSRESASRLDRGKTFGLRDRAPAAWSVAMHALLLAAAAFVPWSERQLETPPRLEVVWVREWPPAETPRQPDEPQRQEPQPESPPLPSKPPESTRLQSARPEEPPARSGPSAAQASSASSSPRTPRASTKGQAPTPRRGKIDWDAERRLAIQQLSREQARMDRSPTFSFNDIIPKSPPKEDDPMEHLFDGGDGGSPAGRSVLGVGQSRTKVGRFLSDLCNALTGGVSVFGVMSLCARDTTGPYAASPLRPAYLKKLPVCEEVVLASPPMQPAEGASTSSADPSATSTIKCRLLTEAERAEYWRNAVERLRRDERVTGRAQTELEEQAAPRE
jgi:hypothetical protein